MLSKHALLLIRPPQSSRILHFVWLLAQQPQIVDKSAARATSLGRLRALDHDLELHTFWYLSSALEAKNGLKSSDSN